MANASISDTDIPYPETRPPDREEIQNWEEILNFGRKNIGEKNLI